MKRVWLLVWMLVAPLAWAQTGLPSRVSLAADGTEAPARLTIDSIFAAGGITARSPETIQWSPDGRKVSFVQRDDSGEHGALYYIDLASGARAVLVAEEKLATLAPPPSAIKDEREKERIRRYSIASYQWAPDSKHLLFDSQGQLWLYSLDTGTAVQLTATAEPNSDPKFSPDGSRLAYVRQHNLVVRSLKNKDEDEGETQLTRGPDKAPSDELLNGEVDWLYAEELNVRSNYFWSPDGKQIAFLQMNEKPVPSYPITEWLPQHPQVESEKYPNAGDPNPEVRVGVIGAGGGNVKWITLGAPQDREYIPRFGWIRPGLIWVQILNRAQNQLELWFAEVSSGKSRRMLTESQPDAWVPVNDDFQIVQPGGAFLWSSWRDGHTHLYLYSFDPDRPLSSDARLQRQLTRGNFEMLGVSAVDNSTGIVYFTANPGDPRQRQLYAVKLDGSAPDSRAPMERLSRTEGSHQVMFAPQANYYLDTFSAFTTPPVMSLCKLGASCNPVWQARSVAAYRLLTPRKLELKAADGVTTIYGILLMPEGVPPESKIPVVLNPYGGPDGSVMAADAWGGWDASPALYLFDQVLAQQGYAVLLVDNRGTADRGRAFAAAVKSHLGQVELADQLAALDQVLNANPQLDSTRIGFWGWSYGGYLSLYALTHSERFQAGVAVAPVSDWHDYDSVYTERYMGLPQDNESGYRASSAVNAAAKLHGRLLEVHGTSDDNVHFQNTVQMVHALIEAGVQFDLQIYPGKTHGISGDEARKHLFHLIEDHFAKYLQPLR